MNANFELDDLLNLGHLATAAEAGAVADLALNLPKVASSIHFDPTGQQVASRSRTDYAGVKLSSDGRIVGGQLAHVASDPADKRISSSSVLLAPDGSPRTIHTDIADRFGDGLFKTVEVDASGLQWTPIKSVAGGQARVRTLHAATRALRMDGVLNFAGEAVQSGVFDHYAWAGDGKRHGRSEVDYRQAKFAGNRIVGGYCAVTFRDADQAVRSTSSIFMSPQSRVSQVHTTTYEPQGGAAKTKVVADFSAVEHTPQGHLHAGEARLTATDASGAAKSETRTTFAGGVPTRSVVQTFKGGKAWQRIETDYSAARFNNDLNVVSSEITASIFDEQSRLLARSTIAYDANGNYAKKSTETLSARNGESLRTTIRDYAHAIFGHARAPVGGSVATVSVDHRTGQTVRTVREYAAPVAGVAASAPPLPPPAPQAPSSQGYVRQQSTVTGSDGAVSTQSRQVLRPDGTLLQSVVTSFRGQAALGSVVTNYAPDGKTVVKRDTIDLSQLAYDPKQRLVSGQLAVSSNRRGVVVSTSTLAF